MKRTALLIPVLLVPLGLARAGDEKVEKVLARAIEAMGGEEKLKAVEGTRVKSAGSLFFDEENSLPYTAEWWFRLPMSFKWTLHGGPSQMTQWTEGKTVWQAGEMTPPGEEAEERGAAAAPVRTLEGREAAEFLEWARDGVAGLLVPLRGPDWVLTHEGEADVRGTKTDVLKVLWKGKGDRKLYVAQDSGLVVKTQRTGYDPESRADVLTEVYASDFRDVKGLKFAWKAEVHKDGKKLVMDEVTELVLEAPKAAEFAPPGPAGKGGR